MKNIISRLFGLQASIRFPKIIQNRINSVFSKKFKMDLSDFKESHQYSSIQRLFTRDLQKERSFSKENNIVISPTDSTIAQFGNLDKDKILQVKGLSYNLHSFLTEEVDKDFVKKVENGSFINFYLSPKDYHHFHAPIDFKIRKIIHIPGALFPVKKKYLENKKDLYVKNERVVLECELENSKVFYFVAIGALNVGKIVIQKEPSLQTNKFGRRKNKVYNYPSLINIRKGEDIGHFMMGSSVVLLFENNSIDFSNTIKIGEHILFGQEIAKII